MIEVLNSFLMTLVVIVSIFYVWCKLLNKDLNLKSSKFWIILIGLVTLTALNYYMINNFIRIVCITIVFAIVCSYMFQVNIKTGMLAALTSQLLFMIGETIFVIMISIVFGTDSDFIESTQFGTVLANALISMIVIGLAQFKGINKLYQIFQNVTKNINNTHLITIIFIFMLILNIFAMVAYYELDFKMMLIFNVLIMVIYFVIIMTSLKNKHDYIEVYDKYNTTLSNLKEYEDILNRYRVSNHENKNELLTIRNMVKNNENNIPEYIDALVENKLKDNEKLMGKSLIIPEGGLRGLIYSKMLLMKEKEIDFELNVDKSIRAVQLIGLGDATLLSICKIVGVFLDNAIEAVDTLEERFIDLEMSIEGKKIYISVTNNFKGNIDLDYIEENGYSTKGVGHGYGLTLVKDLVANDKLLSNEKKITRNEFTQRIVINISKVEL